MSVTVKLLGPDLPNPVVVVVDGTASTLQIKERALGEWPSGLSMPTPTIQQIRLIHQGRFMPDEKTLKDLKVNAGDTCAMHLVIKQHEAKTSDAPSAGDEKTPKCHCIIC
jgi:hypothetical protein